MTKKLTLKQEIYEALSAPFPIEAYSVDSSRGFDLSSLKAQYIVERFNLVMGLGNWHLIGEFKEIGKDVLYFGKLEIRIEGEWIGHEGVGYSATKRNIGDVYKSARTDCLSKTGSLFGVGNDSFKGLVDPKQIKAKTPFKAPQRPTEASKVASFEKSMETLRKIVSDKTDNFKDAEKCFNLMGDLGIKKWSELSSWDEKKIIATIAALS